MPKCLIYKWPFANDKWKISKKLCDIELVYGDKPTLGLTEKLKQIKPSKMILFPVVCMDWRVNQPRHHPEVVYSLNLFYNYNAPDYDITGMVNLEFLYISLDCTDSQVRNVTTRILEPIISIKYLRSFVFEVYGINHHWRICDYLPPSLKYFKYENHRRDPPPEKLKIYPNLEFAGLFCGKIKVDVTISKALIRKNEQSCQIKTVVHRPKWSVEDVIKMYFL